MKIFQSIVFKFWLTMVGFSLGLLVILGWFFSTLFSDFYIQRETADLVNKATMIGLEQDINAARRLAMAIARDSGAIVFLGDTEGNITEILSHRMGPVLVPQSTNGSYNDEQPATPWRGPRFRGGMGPMMGPMMGPQNGWSREPGMHSVPARFNLPKEDMERLARGEVVSRRGQLPMFDSPTLSVAVPLRQGNKVARVVFIHTPLQPISETISDIRTWVYGASGFTLLLSVFVAFLLSKKVSHPLTMLHAAAENMRKGDFKQRVPIQGSDEIGRLGQTLNTLAEELSDSLSQLEKKNSQLARGMQSMRDLVANVSHDLRTPLFLVQGYAEALRDEMPKTREEHQEMTETILEETERMQRLVQDLLQLAQLEAGSFHFIMEPTSPEEVIRRVQRKMSNIANEKQIDLICTVPENAPEILADADRLQQSLINLVDNAIRHTPSGGRVTLSLEVDYNVVRFSVTDTGPGLPEEDIPRIWERFYRGDKSRNRKTPGTGLGLAIVKAIVEGHVGQVGLYTEPGRGATFYFTIPYEKRGQ